MKNDEQSQNSCLAVVGENISFSFGKQVILKELDFATEKGTTYGLLGPSGCGKTTLLRCIVGMLKPSSGTIKIYGKNPGQKGFCVPGPGVGFMPQELALYPEITMEETLTYFGRIYQMSERNIKERISFLAELLEIPDKKKLIKQLSGGQQRRVSFAAAIIHKPPLVILDEPTVGVDPLLRKSIWNYLQKLASVDFITIIITTHYIEEARQAHTVGLMRRGRLLAEANPEQLLTLHNSLTLEDVFLKLCALDTHATEAQENAQMVLDKVEERKSNTENYENAWIKEQEHCLPLLPMNNSVKTTCLLSDPGNLESALNPEMNIRSKFKRSTLRMRALITKRFLRLKRNIPFVVFQMFVPMLQITIFCLCIGGKSFDLPLAIVNTEEDPLGKSEYFLEHLNSKIIRQIHFSNLTEAVESVKSGKNWGVLYIGPSFTGSLINRLLGGISVTNETIEESSISLYLDMTNQQILLTLLNEIMEGFQLFSKNALKEFNLNPYIANIPLKIEQPIYGHETSDFSVFMTPGMILGITYIMAVALSGMTIILEKKEGLLDRSWIAGVPIWEMMLSILLTLSVLMISQVLLVLLCTFLAFDISCLGSLIWVVICVILAGFEGMAYGLLISSIVDDENLVAMIAIGTFLPNLLLSGIIWPVEAMHYYLRYFSYCLPLTLLANTMRCVLSRGWSITDYGIWNGYLVAIAWIVPVIIISSMFFKYKK